MYLVLKSFMLYKQYSSERKREWLCFSLKANLNVMASKDNDMYIDEFMKRCLYLVI